MNKATLDIIYQDENFLALNKPAGILTIPDRHDDALTSLYSLLQRSYTEIYIVHRLDKETSGIILFAKNKETHKYLSQLFESRKVEKYYLGLIKGSLQIKSGTIDEPLMDHPVQKGMMVVNRKGKPSITDYEVIEDHKLFSLVKFRLHTGRTHQIRVHMKHMGHPLVGDVLYGDGQPVLLSSFKRKFKLSQHDEAERPLLSRLALHSHELIFDDINSQRQQLTAELPKDIRAVLQQLRKVITQ